ncbi:MAG: glycosyltransferase, partial [Planctomycetaceae bacterium]
MMFDWLFPALGWLLLAFWVIHLVPLWPLFAWGTLRRRTARIPEAFPSPSVSVIVPARNEGPHIAASVRSLLALDYPAIELLVIDDRSDDETGAILDRTAAENPRLRVTHVTELPAGWLGKNHAMHTGALMASGEFLLFTDGDVLFEPDTLRLALRYVIARKLDHLCLIPYLIPGGYWENVATTGFAFLFTAATRPWLIPTRWKGAYCGVGAFNLVRRSTYDATGGFDHLRLDVLDDVHLGRMIKQRGYRQDALLSGGTITVRWQHSFWGVIRGLEKNSFATLDYSVAR